MRFALPTARAPWFLAERLLAQAGGLALVAVLARRAAPEDAAAFIAAYALASLAQPLFANACQPVLIRLIQNEQIADGRGLLGSILLMAALISGVVIAASLAFNAGLVAAMFVHIAVTPLALASAPLIAADRWRTVLAVTIPASAIGISARLLVMLLGGDLWFVALLFAVEPLVGGAMLMRRAGFSPQIAPPRRTVLAEAAPLIAGMGASSLFWRSPVLIAALVLPPAEVLQIAFAMQLVTGMLLLPNALCQSLIGLLAGAAATRHAALSAGGAAAVICGAGAIGFAAIFGQPMLSLVYGEAAVGAGAMLLILSPLVGLGLIWRLVELSAALSGLGRALVVTRFAALGGQVVLLAAVLFWPEVSVVAIATPISLAFAALMVPALMPSLGDAMGGIWAGTRSVLSRKGLRASQAVFAKA